MRFFPIRFHRLSTFCLFFAETTILTRLLCVDMAMNMANMGVSAKNRKNRIHYKVMAKTKYFVKKGPKMADFLCTFCRNLKLIANCKQNSEIFFGGLKSISPALGKIRNSYSNIFEFQDTLM